MNDPYSPETMDALRTILREILIEQGKLTELISLTRVSRDKLKKFMPEGSSYDLKLVDLRRIFKGVGDYLETRTDSRVFALHPQAVTQVFRQEAKVGRDNYRGFKSMVGLSEDELADFSRQIAGTYLAFRAYKKVSVLVSHARVLDTYSVRGLPICQLKRRTSVGATLTIDGSVILKNSRVSAIGYERSSGDVASLNLVSIGSGYQQLHGHATGFEVQGPPYAARLAFLKIPAGAHYAEVESLTGGYETPQDAIEATQERLGENAEGLRQIATWDTSAYSRLNLD